MLFVGACTKLHKSDRGMGGDLFSSATQNTRCLRRRYLYYEQMQWFFRNRISTLLPYVSWSGCSGESLYPFLYLFGGSSERRIRQEPPTLGPFTGKKVVNFLGPPLTGVYRKLREMVAQEVCMIRGSRFRGYLSTNYRVMARLPFTRKLRVLIRHVVTTCILFSHGGCSGFLALSPLQP